MNSTLGTKPQNSTNSDKNTGFGNLIPYVKGQSGNPKGRPVGARSYHVLFREAIIKLAELNGKEPSDLELEIIQSGIANARKGDFRFYKDILDRLHGMAKQSIDLKGDLTISQILDGLEIEGQNVEAQPLIQDQEQGGQISSVQAEQSAEPLPPEQVV